MNVLEHTPNCAFNVDQYSWECTCMGEKTYESGWMDAVAHTRPPSILTVDAANELLHRCEIAFNDGPRNKRADVMVPAEMLHELLVVWKAARN